MEDSKHSTVLLTNLSPDWFHWSDSTKNEMFGPDINVLKESCSDKMERTSIMCISRTRERVLEREPRLLRAGIKTSVIIAEETTSLSITLNNSWHCGLLEEIASSLPLEVDRKAGNSYILTGYLDVIVEFRKTFDRRVMRSRDPPVTTGGSGFGATASSSTVDWSDTPEARFEKVLERFSPNALVMMKDTSIQGVWYALKDGAVFVDRGVPDREAIIQELRSLHDKIVQQKPRVEVFKIPPCMSVHSIKEEVKSLKQQYDRCAFYIMEDVMQVKLVSISSRQFETVKMRLRRALDSLSIPMPHGHVLTLKMGNIVEEQVGIIVNAANRFLDHSGGVALAIDKASNYEVGAESRQYIQRNKPVKVGDVAVTGAGGALLCTFIIHAVGPVKSDRDCKGTLNKLLHNILKKAEELGANSIAIPAISSGIFGVDKNLVASCVFGSILNHRFTKPIPVLGDIRVVIIDQPTFDCFRGHMEVFVSKSRALEKGSAGLKNPSAGHVSSPNHRQSSPDFDAHAFTSDGSSNSGVLKGFANGTQSYAKAASFSGRDGGGVSKDGGRVGKDGGVGKDGEGVGKGRGGVGKGAGGVGKDGGGGRGKEEGKCGATGGNGQHRWSGEGGGGDGQYCWAGEGGGGDDGQLQGEGGADGSDSSSKNPTPQNSSGATSINSMPPESQAWTSLQANSSAISLPAGTNPPHSTTSHPPGMNPSAPVFSGSYPKCVICWRAPPNDQMTICDSGEHFQCKGCIDMIRPYFPYCPACIPHICRPFSFPRSANCQINTLNTELPGYPKSSTIKIEYNVPDVKDHLGNITCRGLLLIAYLPNCPEGVEVARLFQEDFDEKLTFTVLCEDTVVCTHLYHKTSMHGGGLCGYPDASYLQTVKGFLTARRKV